MSPPKDLDALIDAMSQATSSEESTKAFARFMENPLLESITEQDIVERMVVALQKPNSASLPRIWDLFDYLDVHSWEYVSQANEAFIMNYLREHWGKFTDWLGTFRASEILGKRDPSDATLRFFKNAVEVIPPPQNALACYGIQKVADSTSDSRIANAALAILKDLEKHPDKEVQKEARQAIGKISRKSA